MKKNISTNISGIIFHIEEDGYEKLKAYLESINRYFSNFEDSLEIIADIESRIAEIFLSKLKDGKQVVTIEDVEALMATMGSIKDFQAAEEESSYIAAADTMPIEKAAEKEEDEEAEAASEQMFARKLYRDKKRKLLGGVLAGVAHYFNIDPLWIRLIFVLLFFGISVLPSIAGFLFIAYVVMWIAVPESSELTDERKIKKMYRNPDDKVLGGVASGVAAYFGVDIVLVRLLFVAGIFVAGLGLILYIILWIILPEAKTITDKMEMKGQPVTLSNIERNIKKSLNVEGKEENIFVKILLFPFRLVAALINFLSGALGPILSFLAEAARIILGIGMLLAGVSVIVMALITVGILIGLVTQGGFQGDFYLLEGIPFELIRSDFNLLTTLGLAVLVIIPMLFLALAGLSIIIKKLVFKARLGWLLLALWLIGVIVVGITATPVVKSFQTKGTVTIEQEYRPAGRTLVFRVQDSKKGVIMDDRVAVSLRSSDGDMVSIEQRYEATGTDTEDARMHAKMAHYDIEVEDSVFVFDRYLRFEEDSRYRLQHLDIVVYVPEGRPFVIDTDMRHLLGNFLYREGYSYSDVQGNTWQFDSLRLECITCPPDKSDEEASLGRPSDSDFHDEIEGYRRTFDIQDFSSIEVNSPFEVMVRNGGAHSIVLNGAKEVINDIVVDKTGDLLSIDFKSGAFDWKGMNKDKTVKVYITAPEIEKMEFGGASRASVQGFAADILEMALSGAASAEADMDVDQLNLELKGAARLQLSGSCNYLKGDLSGAATLDAFGFNCKNADIKARTASSGKIMVTGNLQVDASGSSKILYRGKPKTEITRSSTAEIKAED